MPKFLDTIRYQFTVTFKYFHSLVNMTLTSEPAEHILVIYLNPFQEPKAFLEYISDAGMPALQVS